MCVCIIISSPTLISLPGARSDPPCFCERIPRQPSQLSKIKSWCFCFGVVMSWPIHPVDVVPSNIRAGRAALVAQTWWGRGGVYDSELAGNRWPAGCPKVSQHGPHAEGRSRSTMHTQWDTSTLHVGCQWSLNVQHPHTQSPQHQPGTSSIPAACRGAENTNLPRHPRKRSRDGAMLCQQQQC